MGSKRLAEHRGAEVGEAAVGNDNKACGKLKRLLGGAVPLARRADAHHPPLPARVLQQFCHARLEHVHARRLLRLVPEVDDEAAVMEAAALLAARVGDVYGTADTRLDDAVAPRGDGIDAGEGLGEVQALEGADAPGLQELADDAVGFGEGAFEEEDAEGTGEAGGRGDREVVEIGEALGECAACDAGSDDEDVVVGVCRHLMLLNLLKRIRKYSKDKGPYRYRFSLPFFFFWNKMECGTILLLA